MTFRIEKIRKYLVSSSGEPAAKRRYPYPLRDCGFLVMGYADGGDWLVSSPLGRNISGQLFKHAPNFGWARAWDRLEGHQRQHLYVLDFPRKAIREVEGLVLTRDSRIIADYDGKHMLVIGPLAAQDAKVEAERLTRESVAIDIATAKTVNRFRIEGVWSIANHPNAIAQWPDGWLMITGSGRDPERDGWVEGFFHIHPLKKGYAFHPFPHPGREELAISPSGRYVLRENFARLPVRDLPEDHPAPVDFDGKKRRYARSVQLWSGGPPYAYRRDLILGWASVEDVRYLGLPSDNAKIRANLDRIAALCAEPRPDPLAGPEKTTRYSADPELRALADTHWRFAQSLSSAHLVWQEDEKAFWWNHEETWICVGLDGEISPPILLKERPVSFIARPGRIGEAMVERHDALAKYILDGSPSADPMVPREAPAPTLSTPDAADDERQRKAQAALAKLVEAATQLRVVIPSLQAEDCIHAIDAMTAALHHGLKWYADKDSVFQLRVEAAGSELGEAQFFAHVESLGPAAAPALSRLLKKCCADPDMWTIWSQELESGCQAFGPAAKALGAVDAGAWPQLAEYLMHVDDAHEGYFLGVITPDFIERHGWREESFNLALAAIVQMRGNLGDAYTYVWKRMKMAAAAESAYSPAKFAALMLAMRDRMLSSAAGTFSQMLAESAKDRKERPAVHGWPTFDELFVQTRKDLTQWEKRLSDELKQRAQ